MPRRKNVFFDPKFNEWLYDALTNLSADQRTLLNRYEVHMLRDSAALKRFIANENLERRLSLLTKLGFEWNLSFFKTSQYFGKAVRDVYKQYTINGKSVDNVAEMIRQKVFVINSKEVALCMALMANNCHSDVYMLNPAFLAFKKTRTTLTKLGQGMAKSNETVRSKEFEAEAKTMSELIYQSIMCQDIILSMFNIRALDLAILLFLYRTPRNYVSMDNIKSELKTDYKPQSIGLRASYLCRERRFIDKRPSSENVNSYIIMQEGILLVGHVMNAILNRVYTQ